MKKSTHLLNILFLNLPISIVLCFTAQTLAVFQNSIPNLNLKLFLTNLCVAYPAACVIGLTIPCAKWGIAFAQKSKADPASLMFGLLVNIPINTTYSVILSIVMTFFNACILGKAPLSAVPSGFLSTIIPIWAVCYIISFLMVRPAKALAEYCTRKEKN